MSSIECVSSSFSGCVGERPRSEGGVWHRPCTAYPLIGRGTVAVGVSFSSSISSVFQFLSVSLGRLIVSLCYENIM